MVLRMRFTVIVPTYGRQQLLTEALWSIRVQTLQDFECIIVDDASPEPVELPFVDDRFRLIRRTTSGGPGGARNTGLMQARGDNIAFLDDDDLFTPNRLETANRLLQRADLSFCAAGKVGYDSAVAFRKLTGNVHDVILDCTSPHLGTIAIRRQSCPMFDETFDAAEDLDWILRVTKSSNAASSGEVGWLWRRHEEIRVRHGARARIAGSYQLIDRHRSYFETHRRARGFRYYRISSMSLDVGDRRMAVISALRSLRAGYIRSLKQLPIAFLSLRRN